MIRQIIVIDKDRCNGCGLCVNACHEGAIGLIDGKAALLRDDFCDGMGDCLPACPADAISFEEREAAAYDEAAVLAKKAASAAAQPVPGAQPAPHTDPAVPAASQLAQWPCQIKLVPPVAPFFAGTKLLVSADCCAYAHPDFHRQFMAGHTTVVGCPKLDAVDYTDKLAAILANNSVTEVLLTRMDVPCCGGLQRAVSNALAMCGKDIPATVVTIGRDGSILNQAQLA